MRHRLSFFGASAELNEVKAVTLRKLHLFERSESAVFSHWFYVEKGVDSCRPVTKGNALVVKPLRELFCVLFLR